MDKKIVERPNTEYTKPEISDYGDLQDLTAATTTHGITDVPKGTPGPGVIFS